jgi:hypothetical protein
MNASVVDASRHDLGIPLGFQSTMVVAFAHYANLLIQTTSPIDTEVKIGLGLQTSTSLYM